MNPLCEYVVEATASRRNAIIKRCKFPSTYITKWYNEAEDILAFYLSEIKDDPKQLMIEADRLRTRSYDDDMEKKYAVASASALKSFVTEAEKIRVALELYTLEMSVNENRHKFILKGVQISLRPELIVRDYKGKQQLGFVKFYFGKDDPLSEPRGELMACLLRHYFELEHGLAFKTQHCMVLDVYRGRLFYAPKAFKRRVADIEASLQEIADRWAMITP